jgi:hypothetical protein
MAIGRRERFDVLRPPILELFGDDVEMTLQVERVLTLTEMAWHDCYGEVSPPGDVIENIFVCSGGTLEGLVEASHLAVIDSRDLAVWASSLM